MPAITPVVLVALLVTALTATAQQQRDITSERYRTMDETYSLSFNPLNYGWLPTSGVGQDDFQYAKPDTFHRGLFTVRWSKSAGPLSRTTFEDDFQAWMEAIRAGSQGTNQEVLVSESRVESRAIAGQSGLAGYGLLVSAGKAAKWRITYVVRFTQASINGRMFTFRLFYWHTMQPLDGDAREIYRTQDLDSKLRDFTKKTEEMHKRFLDSISVASR